MLRQNLMPLARPAVLSAGLASALASIAVIRRGAGQRGSVGSGGCGASGGGGSAQAEAGQAADPHDDAVDRERAHRPGLIPAGEEPD